MNKGWIGVDFDGTLAFYDTWRGAEHLGDPILAMVDRVRTWVENGWEVRIFTARVSHDGTETRIDEANRARRAIQGWCLQYLGADLEVTNVKDWQMIELWDDRAVQVEANTGHLIGHSTRGL